MCQIKDVGKSICSTPEFFAKTWTREILFASREFLFGPKWLKGDGSLQWKMLRLQQRGRYLNCSGLPKDIVSYAHALWQKDSSIRDVPRRWVIATWWRQIYDAELPFLEGKLFDREKCWQVEGTWSNTRCTAAVACVMDSFKVCPKLDHKNFSLSPIPQSKLSRYP